MLRARELTVSEVESVERWARSRTEPARVVERAEIIRRAHAGEPVRMIAREMGVGVGTVRLWVKRFNAAGVDGLADEPRAGRPPTYTPEDVGEVVAAALTKPTDIGLPFGAWTLDRLAAYLNEEKGIPIKRSRIDEVLVAEGLRWRQQETWFGERAGVARPPGEDGGTQRAEPPVDPAFAQKRGPSRRSTPTRRTGASSCA